MYKAIYFYLPYKVEQLQKLISSFEDHFEQILIDTFSDDELEKYQSKIDDLAVVNIQPLFSEMVFDDFQTKEDKSRSQRFFFESCLSTICIENIPFLESNPIQVTYLLELLDQFDEVLVDKGGLEDLCFKQSFVMELKRQKSISSLIQQYVPKITYKNSLLMNDPLDALVADIYREIDLSSMMGDMRDLPSSASSLLGLMLLDKFSSTLLFSKSKLGPKDFGDSLERIKFFLKGRNL